MLSGLQPMDTDVAEGLQPMDTDVAEGLQPMDTDVGEGLLEHHAVAKETVRTVEGC